MSNAHVAKAEHLDDERLLHVAVHLRHPRELFAVADFDPFQPEATARSGVDQIRVAALAVKKPEHISVMIYLPHEYIQDAHVPTLRAALERYCSYHVAEVKAEIASLRRTEYVQLRVGTIVFLGCLLLGLLLLPLLTSSSPALVTLGQILSGALVIAVWVVVWAVIETFFVEPIPLRWERRFLQRLRDADLAVLPEPA